MTDKDVERNVRSTTVEGIRTPTERHVHGIGEKHAISFGEKSQASKTREALLEKFRKKELRRKETGHQHETGEKTGERGEQGGGEDIPE